MSAAEFGTGKGQGTKSSAEGVKENKNPGYYGPILLMVVTCSKYYDI